jgi:tryptophan 2,3-dioxygenase
MPSRDGRPAQSGKVLNPAQPNPLLRYEYDRGSNYEEDTRLATALSALVPEAELHSRDHRFFQVMHLVTEYSWVAVHHTLCDIEAALSGDQPVTARRLLDRAANLAELPVSCVRQLIRSLPQTGLLHMRGMFPPNTTGLDSPGARNLRRACSAVWSAFERAMARGEVDLAVLIEAASTVHRGDERTAVLADAMAGMYRFDQLVMEWKQVHLQMVWMMVGGQPFAAESADPPDDTPQTGPSSLRGRPVSDLERMAMRPMFPRLWQASTETFIQNVTHSGENTS